LDYTEKQRDFFANQWGKVKKKKKSQTSRYSFTVSCLAVFGYKPYRLQTSRAGSKKGRMGRMEKNKSLEEFVQQQNDSDSESDVSDTTQSSFRTTHETGGFHRRL